MATKRLIDANDAVKVVTDIYCGTAGYMARERLWQAVEAVKEIPTVDAVEVVHGRWENNHCTVCGMTPLGEELWDHLDIEPPRFELCMDYCPNCGAKMDGDGNGN